MVDHERKTPYTRWLAKLDNSLGKPDNQELITIYAGGGTGKTEFTYFVARANADSGIKVCYLSLEMPAEQMALRYAVKRAGIKKYIDFQEKRYTTHQGELIDKHYKEFMEYKNIKTIWWDNAYTIDQLLSDNPESVWIMQEYYDMWYRMFVIDNLGKIASDKQERDAQAEISSKLQTWKNKYNCLVFLIHHAGSSKKEVRMRGSEKIQNCSTKVIRLQRDMSDPDAWPADRARLEIKLEKDSIWGDYVETECYFDRGVYIEEYVGNMYTSKKVLQSIVDSVEDDDLF